MELVDLERANALAMQKMVILRALENFDNGGVIISLTISAEPPSENWVPERMAAIVSTIGMNYPPQMVEAIKGSLESRRDAIAEELEEMGVAV